MTDFPFPIQTDQLLAQHKAGPKMPKNFITEDQVEQLSKDFSAHFFSHFIEEMTKNMGDNALFHGGQTEKVFRGFYNQEVAKNMIETFPSSQLPVSPDMMKQMLGWQEA